MFAALSAVVTGAAESSVFDVDEAVLDHLDRRTRRTTLRWSGAARGLPPPGRRGNGDGTTATAPIRGASESELRERNARLVQDLVWATGLGHAQVNGQLNRLVGLRRIDEATVEQLRRRARQAERWLCENSAIAERMGRAAAPSRGGVRPPCARLPKNQDSQGLFAQVDAFPRKSRNNTGSIRESAVRVEETTRNRDLGGACESS